MGLNADVIVVGAGLSGLVATAELADAGKRVVVVDQESEASIGGQAFWSFGGVFLVDTPEQRALKIHDSRELAWLDWLASSGWREGEGGWGRRWAEAYVDFAAGEKRAWLRKQGVRFAPTPAWVERGGRLATDPGNSVPRFHITWGTGPGLVDPFVRRVERAVSRGLVRLAFRHRVDGFTQSRGIIDGVQGSVLAPTRAPRGAVTSREVVGSFEFRAQAVLAAAGGIGGNLDLVRKSWPARLGAPPRRLLVGVPAHVDGRMLGILEAAGGHAMHGDRMWHYAEGVENFDPIWPGHAIRIVPGPSSLWLDAVGNRLPAPIFPGFDTLGALEHVLSTGHEHSWFVLTRRIMDRELILSGSEQNPALTGRSVGRLARLAAFPSGRRIHVFRERGVDFVTDTTLRGLVDKMNALTGGGLLEFAKVESAVVARDLAFANPFSKDAQAMTIHATRRYFGDRFARVASPHRLLDPSAGPLIAIRLNVMTRKTLGGLETDLDGRILMASGAPLEGVFAAGEVAGFGGGGIHGIRSLEGTFLGSCLFTGRTVGRALAAHV